jgi:hypothetical protein
LKRSRKENGKQYTNRDLKRNPCLLYRLSTFNLSFTDKVEEVIKFEKLGSRRENGKQYSRRRKKKGENRKKKGNQK